MTSLRGIHNRLICKFATLRSWPKNLTLRFDWRVESGDRHLIKVSSWQQQVDPNGK